MIYFHDPLIPGDRLPAGAVTTGDSVRLRLRIAQRDGAAMPEAELRVVRRFRTETE